MMYESEWARECKFEELMNGRVSKTRRNRTNHYGLNSLDDYDHYGMDLDDESENSSGAMRFGH